MFSSTTQTAHRFRGLALGVVVFALCAVAALATSASPASASSCGAAPTTRPSPPRIMLHLSEMEGDGSLPPFSLALQLIQQMQDAVNQFNAIGATSARISDIETTYDPFVWKGSYDDSVPTIHVGFQPQPKITADNGGGGALALTRRVIYLSSNCSPTTTSEFSDLVTQNWSFASPFMYKDNGSRFYDAGRFAPTTDGGGEWFRPSFLHEMLHAFGLQHTDSFYAMMNNRGLNNSTGGFPWANRADADAVRPLPYDDKLIRDAYPASGSRWEVAPLDTWFQVTATSAPNSADQVKLCTPSLGTQFTNNQTTSGPCGTGGTIAGSTQVSEGDTLRTRFALANYSTGSMHVTSRLWLSTDEQLSDGDIPANSWDIRDIPAETSDLAEVAFKLPWLPEGSYHPIVVLSSEHLNADGSVDPHSPTSDWIPLRGTVYHCVATSSGLEACPGTRIS
jgi:hypothetical protein